MKKISKKSFRAAGKKLVMDNSVEAIDQNVLDLIGVNNIVELENIVTDVITVFLASAKRLGCKGEDVSKWYLGLSAEEKYKISGKLIDIIEEK
jgi:hypothetical protein